MPTFWETVLTSIISAGVVSAAITGGVSLWNSASDRDQKNVALILQTNEAQLRDSPAHAAIYAALMVDGKLIDEKLGCDLVGLALFTGKSTREIFIDVVNALSPEEIATRYSSPPCNLAKIATPPAEVDTIDEQPLPAATAQCPPGRLFTQFGAEEQRAFGTQLQKAVAQGNLGGARVEAPEVVKGFDAKNPVVRYFFTDRQEAARSWQSLLEAMIPGIDVKFAYTPGYEAAFSSDRKDTFELWWPKGLATPASIGAPVCAVAATS